MVQPSTLWLAVAEAGTGAVPTGRLAAAVAAMFEVRPAYRPDDNRGPPEARTAPTYTCLHTLPAIHTCRGV